MTMSPFFSLTALWSPEAILARADIGSPWLPVVMMTSLLSGMFLVIFRSTSVPAGMSRYPSSRASATTFSMLRPEIATLRPIFTAFSIILCTLWTLDEKVAIIILELEVLKIFSMVCPTTFSEAVYPGLIELGLSHIIRVTPFLPSSARRQKSMGSPSTGV